MINTVQQGDCLELMQEIPTGSVDMILCDLPYGTTQNKWDAVIPFVPLWEQYERVVKLNGAIVLTAAQPFATDLIISNRSIFRYDLIWNKPLGTGFLNANRMPMRNHEHVLVFYRKLPTYNPVMTKGLMKRKGGYDVGSSNYGKYDNRIAKTNDNYYPKSVIEITNGDRTHENDHPTQKPVALFEYLIKTYTNEGETVMDNCAGSFTTAVACDNLNRKWICIEKEEKYCGIGRKRIAENKERLRIDRMQLKLFA